MTRYRNRGVGSSRGCPHCGTYGDGHNTPCRATTCMACGTTQCMGNGSARGTCAICYIGRLPGWSWLGRDRCGYARCQGETVATAPRVRRTCRDHLARSGGATIIEHALAARERNWEVVGSPVRAEGGLL